MSGLPKPLSGLSFVSSGGGATGSDEGAVDALLLAAGRGERLRPLTDVVAKPAIPMPGAPLGAWMLERLLGSFDRVVVNLSHLSHTVISQLQVEGRTEMMEESPVPFGTAGTLAALRGRMAERVVVANADAIADVDLDAVIGAHLSAGADATVVVAEVDVAADFVLDEGEVVGFVDRRERTAAGARFIGVSVFERSTLEALPDERPLGMAETLLRPLVAKGRLSAHIHRGYFADVGTLGRYVDTCGDVLAGSAPPPPSGPYGQFSGRTIEVEGGRAFIAHSARCDGSSLGPGAVVLGGARVDPRARVGQAVVWREESVPPGAQVEHAVWYRGAALKVERQARGRA